MTNETILETLAKAFGERKINEYRVEIIDGDGNAKTIEVYVNYVGGHDEYLAAKQSVINAISSVDWSAGFFFNLSFAGRAKV